MKICKYLIIILAVAFATSCEQKTEQAITDSAPEAQDTTDASTLSAEQLITPGASIGKLKLEGSMADAVKLLGKPDSGDAAMGSALATWYAKHDTSRYRTSIFARHNMGGADENIQHIKKILVTSPWFKTAEFISTGNTKADIEKYYTLKEGTSYNDKGQKVTNYTDLAKGITFEIDRTSKCVGILVHEPNSAADTYLNMH